MPIPRALLIHRVENSSWFILFSCKASTDGENALEEGVPVRRGTFNQPGGRSVTRLKRTLVTRERSSLGDGTLLLIGPTEFCFIMKVLDRGIPFRRLLNTLLARTKDLHILIKGRVFHHTRGITENAMHTPKEEPNRSETLLVRKSKSKEVVLDERVGIGTCFYHRKSTEGPTRNCGKKAKIFKNGACAPALAALAEVATVASRSLLSLPPSVG
uniref:Uncharacterized protein n=1 Tax=Brassica oleracea TaxID=3712 RepID=A0A3P6FRF3_BRAOL|nr:unnamed protein product [Brassica oleracea]